MLQQLIFQMGFLVLMHFIGTGFLVFHSNHSRMFNNTDLLWINNGSYVSIIRSITSLLVMRSSGLLTLKYFWKQQFQVSPSVLTLTKQHILLSRNCLFERINSLPCYELTRRCSYLLLFQVIMTVTTKYHCTWQRFLKWIHILWNFYMSIWLYLLCGMKYNQMMLIRV